MKERCQFPKISITSTVTDDVIIWWHHNGSCTTEARDPAAWFALLQNNNRTIFLHGWKPLKRVPLVILILPYCFFYLPSYQPRCYTHHFPVYFFFFIIMATSSVFCAIMTDDNHVGSILVKIKAYRASLPTMILAGGYLSVKDRCMAWTTLRLSQLIKFCATSVALQASST